MEKNCIALTSLQEENNGVPIITYHTENFLVTLSLLRMAGFISNHSYQSQNFCYWITFLAYSLDVKRNAEWVAAVTPTSYFERSQRFYRARIFHTFSFSIVNRRDAFPPQTPQHRQHPPWKPFKPLSRRLHSKWYPDFATTLVLELDRNALLMII